MASRESEDLRTLYGTIRATLTRNPDTSVEEFRRMLEHVGDVGGEPKGVDYLETIAGGAPALWAVPAGCAVDRVILCVHGGGYATGSRYSHRKLYGHVAKAIGCRALILDYRLAPEHPHPAPLEDVASAYRWLLDNNSAAIRVAVAGDSAGGALSIALGIYAKQAALPQPAAIIALSPWVDMEAGGASIDRNAQSDVFVSREMLHNVIAMFLGPQGNPRDPLANALYADLSGLPPMLVQASTDEVLFSDSERVVELARAAGVDVTFDTYPEMQHVFQFLAGNAPEADEAIRRLGAWARPKLGLDQ